MKQVLILFVICVQSVVIGAVKLNDTDKYIDSNLYTFPNKLNIEIPLQSEIKKVKVRELDKNDRVTIDRNLDRFLKDSSNDDIQNNVFTALQDNSFNFKYTQLGKPVYVKGREGVIKRMPALDQAQTDTCATFSSTAAMDILIGNGRDVFSNYMSLCLGHTLALKMLAPGQGLLTIMNAINEFTYPNPWDGSEGIIIFTQFKDYGLVKTKDKNSQNGKFGENEKKRPLNKKSIGKFKKIPELNFTLLYHNELWDINEVFASKGEFVRKIKNEINKGNIVSVGVYLATGINDINTGMIGKTEIVNGRAVLTDAEQENTADYNTWCLTKWLAKYIKKNKEDDNFVGSHQIIIIGYIDDIGNKNNGVFILRNSWGASNGDNGNNYITYDYLYYLTNEVVTVSADLNKKLKKNKKFL